MIKNTLLAYSNHTKKIYLHTKNIFKPQFFVKLAESKSEIKQAQKLRYQVFFLTDYLKQQVLELN